jgi:hypothetical protein
VHDKKQLSIMHYSMPVDKKRSVLRTNTKFFSGHRRFSPGCSHSPEISNIGQSIGHGKRRHSRICRLFPPLVFISFKNFSFFCVLSQFICRRQILIRGMLMLISENNVQHKYIFYSCPTHAYCRTLSYLSP